MKTLATVAVIPLFAGFLWAQATRTETQTTTTKTTYSGTLVDAGCRTTHTEHKESANSPDENTTKTTTTTTESVECPVTTTTTTFGLLTPEGKFIRFDEPSNTRVVEMVKGNKGWHSYITDRKPLKVRVIGEPTATNDTIVVETIR